MSCKTCNGENGSINTSATSEDCFESRFTPKLVYKIKKTNKAKSDFGASPAEDCCDEIDLDNITRTGVWEDGECLIVNDLKTGYKTFNTLRVSSKEKTDTFTIPTNITPYALATLTRLSLKESIALIGTRTIKSNDCRNEFCNDAVSKNVTKNCPIGSTSTVVTFTIPECQVISNVSKAEANRLAQILLDSRSTSYAECNAQCIENTAYCNDELSETQIKPNCPIGKQGMPVTYTVEAGKYCSARSKAKANEIAQAFLDRTIDRYVLLADDCLYCKDYDNVCNTALSEVVTKDCSGTTISATLSVPAGKYCIPVTANKTEAEALIQANALAQNEIDRNRATTLASLNCPTVCNTQALVGNIRNVRSGALANTYKNPLDYAFVWTQNYINLFESQPAVQAIKGGFGVIPSLNNRFKLELFKNGTKIIDTGTFVDDPYFQLVYNVELGDEIRYLLTFENMFGPETVAEALQRIGCPPAIENLITRTYNEGDGI